MTKLQYLASLREQLLKIIGGVEDTRQWSKFILDNHSSIPNSEIRRKLKNVLDLYTIECKSLGVYIVKKHSECGNPDHGFDVMDDGPFNFDDDRLFKRSWPIGENIRGCVCPCNVKNKSTKHEVTFLTFYDKKYDSFTCEAIRSILEDVFSAFKNAKDNGRRSAIREYLFRSVLKINDLILPAPMDEYISEQLKKRL